MNREEAKALLEESIDRAKERLRRLERDVEQQKHYLAELEGVRGKATVGPTS